MDNEPKKNEIIKVEPKPVETEKKTILPKISNIRIGKVGTLNLVVEPLKKRYETHYKSNKLHLIVDLILAAIVLILLAVLTNLWFFSRSRVNLMEFKVTSSPEQLINGQETEFTISYTNISKNELSDINLILKLPTSLKNPQYNIKDFDTQANTYKIGVLPEKGQGEFTVKGMLIGNFNEKQEFIAAINYKNQYGQADQEFFSQKFELTDSAIKTSLRLPEKVVANSYFNADLILNNSSTLEFSKVKVKLNWPDSTVLKKIDLDRIAKGTYSIGDLNAGQGAEYKIEGKIYGKQDETITLEEEILATYDGQEYSLTKIQNTTILGASNLKLGFLHLENNRNIAPGGQTTYTLFYKNNETYDLENLEIGLILDGDYVDENYLAKNYKNAAGNQVVFNENDYSELTKLLPGQEGSIEIKAAARTTIAFGQYQENGYKLEARVLANYDDPFLKSRLTVESEPIYTQIDSLLTLKTTGIFYTSMGDRIGVGSVPPQVGEYTSYWVIIKINNTNNKIKDLKLSAKVPAGIEFTSIYNVTDGDQINFDEGSRTLTWRLSNVAAFAGVFNPSPEARIQLAIVPTENQINKSPLLLTDIKATATDEVTNAFISASGKNVSTAIFDDPSLNKVIQ